MTNSCAELGGHIEAEDTKLDHRGEQVPYAPVVSDLTVLHAHSVDRLEMNFPASGREAEKRPLVGPVVGFEGRHRVAVGMLPMYLRAEIREGDAQRLVEAAHAVLVSAAIWLRRVIDEIVGEQLVEYIETPVALNLFGISPDDRLSGFAWG